jgi:hypothetical protein
MPSHEAGVISDRVADGALRRADVCHGAPLGGKLEDHVHDRRKCRDRDGHERNVRLSERIGQRICRIDGAPLRGDLERRAILVPAGDRGDTCALGREAGGRADQPGPDDSESYRRP